MFNNKSIIGIIPARGGSKGLPRKNVRPLLGKPLIAWTIEQAKSSKYIDRFIVSTENKKISSIAKTYGADTPFIRPKYLAKDNTSMIDVILHAIQYLEKQGEYYDLIMLLQPTSPLRTHYDIDKSIELLFSKKAQAIVSVCRAEYYLQWSNTLPKDNCMRSFIRPDIMNKKRQDLPIFYRLNGAIFLAFCDYLKTKRNFLGEKTYAYIMPRVRSVDIDDEIDFYFAEFLTSKMKNLF